MSSKFDFDGKTHGFSEFNHQSIKFEVFCNSLYLGSNQHCTLSICLWLSIFVEMKFEFFSRETNKIQQSFKKKTIKFVYLTAFLYLKSIFVECLVEKHIHVTFLSYWFCRIWHFHFKTNFIYLQIFRKYSIMPNASQFWNSFMYSNFLTLSSNILDIYR